MRVFFKDEKCSTWSVFTLFNANSFSSLFIVVFINLSEMLDIFVLPVFKSHCKICKV